MEMKNPAHPGLLVKESLDDLGLTVAEAAAALHITRQQLHNIVAGRSKVTPEMAIRFEKALGSTAETWLRMQMNSLWRTQSRSLISTEQKVMRRAWSMS